ncbi:MAG: Mur ligase family protein, partial [Planctomycetota bacterium]
GRTDPAATTTPGPTEARRHLAAMAGAAAGACVMEVSSHGLQQRRVDGLRFAGAVYTNLTGDHLDYHGSMESYAAAKARLFGLLDAGAVAVLNAGDAACSRVRTAARVVRFGLEGAETGPAGTSFRWRGRRVETALVGTHNAENAVAALECARALGVDPDLARRRLGSAAPVRGRLEPVQRGPYLVLVDYAHTDDALQRALAAVRPLTRGRLILVFGCGGDRDRTKRPRMGAGAARGADRILVTNDNPRTEPPGRIAGEICRGIRGREVRVELDRRRAIAAALREARPGDAVLIAGKGHEASQVIGRERIPFDDAAVARELLARRDHPNCWV